jgi:hypothetical protein
MVESKVPVLFPPHDEEDGLVKLVLHGLGCPYEFLILLINY